ncbi:MAG: iron ABC transporter permease [Flavobacteriales bacterium]|nr:iron ABC transporter permease [Flavobacteriales bacterium]
MHRGRWLVPLLILTAALLFLLALASGSVPIPVRMVLDALLGHGEAEPAQAMIVREVRLPGAITALVAGAGLAVCGLLMQTLFRNPLAGPSVLGVTSGASLAVAALMLVPGLHHSLPSGVGVLGASMAGAIAVLLLMLAVDRRVGDGLTLLIVGMMVGYLCGALVQVMQAGSGSGALKGFVQWGMGSFGQVPRDGLWWLVVPVLAGLLWAHARVKALNALLMGDGYAASLGVKVPEARRTLLVITGVVAGCITAHCGPVAFLGLATPHVARALFRTADHSRLLPGTMLCGAVLGLLCEVIVRSSGAVATVPLNAVTSLLGAPVVLWVLLSGKRWLRPA